MPTYSGQADPRQRAAAISLVIAVHLLLAAAILTGLNVDTVRRAVDRMVTIAIVEPPEPEVEIPPPEPRKERARDPEGAAGRKAEPTEIVAPKAPLPTPVVAAERSGEGAEQTAGAAVSGSGSGAGGTGAGSGGGGSGGTSGFTPARLVRNLGRGDYRALAGDRMPTGSADAEISIARNGRVDGCRVIRSSGDQVIDRALCPLIAARLKFQPARDATGQPVPFRANYTARWRLGF